MTSRDRPQFFGSAPPMPISLAVRAGDFVFTATLGAHRFRPEEVSFTWNGQVKEDGSGLGGVDIAEQTRRTIENIRAALASADCTLDDVIDMTVWLRDPRDFKAMNDIYAAAFTAARPVRAVLQNDFMFDCRIEMKAIAYKPR